MEARIDGFDGIVVATLQAARDAIAPFLADQARLEDLLGHVVRQKTPDHDAYEFDDFLDKIVLDKLSELSLPRFPGQFVCSDHAASAALVCSRS